MLASWSWEQASCTIFSRAVVDEDDWPEVDKIDRMVRKLKGIEVFPKHFFSWTHPDVLAQDTKYIDEYHDLKKRQLIKA